MFVPRVRLSVILGVSGDNDPTVYLTAKAPDGPGGGVDVVVNI